MFGALIFALALPVQADAAVMTFEGVGSSSTYQVPVTPLLRSGVYPNKFARLKFWD
jgi:hypothetical protein